MAKRQYEKLVAWQEAYKLCLFIYDMTRKFPSDERFGLVSQMRRAASSVPINIAEGNVKHSAKDKAHFLEISLGSLDELHCESKLSTDLLYISEKEFATIDDHIHRVSFLITKLRLSLFPKQ